MTWIWATFADNECSDMYFMRFKPKQRFQLAGQQFLLLNRTQHTPVATKQ